MHFSGSSRATVGLVRQLLPRKLLGYMGGTNLVKLHFEYMKFVRRFVVTKTIRTNTQDIEEVHIT
jgi:hypothetical protein